MKMGPQCDDAMVGDALSCSLASLASDCNLETLTGGRSQASNCDTLTRNRELFRGTCSNTSQQAGYFPVSFHTIVHVEQTCRRYSSCSEHVTSRPNS